MSFPDKTDFESKDRNGWVEGEEIPGRLVTEGGNTFWAGELKPLPTSPDFGTSLKKRFTIRDEERSDIYYISFNYRVYKLEDHEARSLILSLAPEDPLNSTNLDIDLDANTEVDTWLTATTEPNRPRDWFSRSNDIIQIGTRGGSDDKTKSRRMDIDNIEVWKKT